MLNLTVTNAAGGGFITAYGEGRPQPTTSNVNFTQGQTVPNLAIVPVGANGYVDLYNGSPGTVDVIADITGYFTRSAAAGYTTIAPTRLVDTRYGTGTAKGQVGGGGSFSAQVAGAAGGSLPGSGITAVALNVTVTNPGWAGFLTVYPSGLPSRPLASNVNFGYGQTIANSVVVPVGADGRINVYNGSARGADVVIDVVGYYSAAGKSAYLPVNPVRLLDTRTPAWKSGPLSGGGYIYMPLSATTPDDTAFVLNTTVTNTGGQGYLTVAPDPNTLSAYQSGTAVWPNRPLVSTLNWLPLQTVPNLVQASGGPTGIIDLWNASNANIDLVVDAFGLYEND